MMHEDKLPELKGLSITQPIQQEWEWSCQYGALHQEYCEECNHCIQHVGLALQWGNPSLKRAIEFPECFMNKEFERGVDYGTRTCQEPVSSADEHLHTACHLMAHHLRITEKERLDLLVRTMAVHSTLNRAGHHNDELEVLCQGLIGSNNAYAGSVFKVISGRTRIESVFQVIFDMQGVSFSNLLPSMVCTE